MTWMHWACLVGGFMAGAIVASLFWMLVSKEFRFGPW